MELIKFYILPFLLFPSWKLTLFAPPLIITLYQRPLLTALWIAFGVGIFLDLTGPDKTFGLYTLNTVLTTAIVSTQKKNFFEESLSTLPILTFFFSVLTTIFQIVLLTFFETPPPLSLKWVWTDILLYPFFDSLYSFIGFTLPWLFWKQFWKRPIPDEELE